MIMSIKRRFIRSNDDSIVDFDLRWKCSHWSRVLKIKNNSHFKQTMFQFPQEKTCDQVQLDVERAYCFDSGLSSNFFLFWCI